MQAMMIARMMNEIINNFMEKVEFYFFIFIIMPEGLKYKLISEKSVKPKLSQYSIPDELLDKTYEMHEFLIECDDMNELFKMLWFIPVRHIIPDENDAIFTRSYRTVP